MPFGMMGDKFTFVNTNGCSGGVHATLILLIGQEVLAGMDIFIGLMRSLVLKTF